MTTDKDIVWGEPFKGENKVPETYVRGTPVSFRVLGFSDSSWTLGGAVAFLKGCEYRLPADHPYYKTLKVGQAITTLKAEGYTVDETTGVLSPPDPMKEKREFVGDLFAAITFHVSERDARKGGTDHIVKKIVRFLNENEHRIPKNTEDK